MEKVWKLEKGIKWGKYKNMLNKNISPLNTLLSAKPRLKNPGLRNLINLVQKLISDRLSEQIQYKVM